MLHCQPALFATCLALCFTSTFAQRARLEIWVLDSRLWRSNPVLAFEYRFPTEERKEDSFSCVNVKDLELEDRDRHERIHARDDRANGARLTRTNANCRVSVGAAKLAGLQQF